MPTPDDQRAILAAAFLGRYEYLFATTGNGAHALQAFRVATHLRVPVPAWVSTYVTTSVASAAGTPMATAFRMATKGGPSAIKKAAIEERNLVLVVMVDHLKARDPDTLNPGRRFQRACTDGAFDIVADLLHMRVERVKRVYFDMKKARPETR